MSIPSTIYINDFLRVVKRSQIIMNVDNAAPIRSGGNLSSVEIDTFEDIH